MSEQTVSTPIIDLTSGPEPEAISTNPKKINYESIDTPLTPAKVVSVAIEETQAVVSTLKPVAPKTVESESQTDREDIERVNRVIMAEDKVVIDLTHKYAEEIETVETFLVEPEASLIQIREKLIELDRDSGDELHNVPLTVDSESSEEDDELKPLMVDNHTVLDNLIYHREGKIYGSREKQLIHTDTKDSLSSTDSEDRTGDRRNSSSHQDGDSSEVQDESIRTSSGGEQLKLQLSLTNGDEVREIDTLNPSEIPDDQTSLEICEQVEFYFSNDNILKDAFLLKHVRRNKEGFVSLKLVSSFKRVRQITKDWRVVGHAIERKSRRIELNDLGTKIRRIDALPTFDETMPSRTIVACDLPVEKLSIERVSDMFSRCGEIALIRILRPGNAIPADVRQFINKYPEMQQKECALVEFVESQSARNAQNMSGNFKIYEMVAPKKKTGKKTPTVTKMIENYNYYENNYERSRGGGVIPHPENDLKFKVRRNNSDYYVKPEQTHIYQQQSQPRKYSFNNNNNNENTFNPYSPRRISNCSINNTELPRKYSSCSEGYSSCSELSRRTSTCSSEQSRRTSSCSEYCPCSRRASHCSDLYRRMSQCSEHNSRKFSNGSIGNYDQRASFGTSPIHHQHQMSDLGRNYERKMSTDSIGGGNNVIGNMFEPYRKYSNGFDPNRKLSTTDQYYNGRRLSTDSGYDRKLSFSSDYSSSPRSRSNSFMMCQHHKGVENVVRTPIGPDGSKGFASRTRKVGQIVPPI